DRPAGAVVTAANVNDITPAKVMPIEPGATYVFDLGYYDNDPTGKVLRILCNDLDATAQEIADLYKRRWAIELFFGWVKQTLKIHRFLGTSENAVRLQIAVALIAFLLLRMAQATQAAIASPLALARFVRTNLMHRRRLDRLLQIEPQPLSIPLNWR